jgi:hypothetical protein
MWKRSLILATAVGLVVAFTGCHHAFGSRACYVERWQLDPDTQIRLTSDVSAYPAWADAELSYKVLSIDVSRRDEVVHHQVLWRHQRNDLTPVVIPSLEELQLRADADRRTVWLVNRRTECVLASYDAGCNTLTIYGESAPWPADREAAELQPLGTPAE